jgi:hypothetical protein
LRFAAAGGLQRRDLALLSDGNVENECGTIVRLLRGSLEPSLCSPAGLIAFTKISSFPSVSPSTWPNFAAVCIADFGVGDDETNRFWQPCLPRRRFPASYSLVLGGESAMPTNKEKTSRILVDDAMKKPEPRDVKIDRDAPAGSENSLGAQSVRDGRPATDDSVVEAMDEEGPGISPVTPEKKDR